MKPTPQEIEYLAAWAREEWEPDCYHRPAHRLQLTHGVRGADLIDFIKAWTRAEGKKDQAILEAASNPNPAWPWQSKKDFEIRRGKVLDSQDTLAVAQNNSSGASPSSMG